VQNVNSQTTNNVPLKIVLCDYDAFLIMPQMDRHDMTEKYYFPMFECISKTDFYRGNFILEN
jgi:hypothetical protein